MVLLSQMRAEVKIDEVGARLETCPRKSSLRLAKGNSRIISMNCHKNIVFAFIYQNFGLRTVRRRSSSKDLLYELVTSLGLSWENRLTLPMFGV
jgi:hypothetical protein